MDTRQFRYFASMGQSLNQTGCRIDGQFHNVACLYADDLAALHRVALFVDEAEGFQNSSLSVFDAWGPVGDRPASNEPRGRVLVFLGRRQIDIRDGHFPEPDIYDFTERLTT